MLKAAQRSTQGNSLGLLRQQQFRLYKTGNLKQDMSNVDQKRQQMYDIQARQLQGVGIVRMNKEHRFNTLTPKFIKQVSRGVETMYIDHSISVIYLSSTKGEHFSNGTDFRTMLHYFNEGKEDELTKYMHDLYKLQIDFAKCNKPIMTVAPGHSFNSAAGLLAASGLPSICHDTKIAFNECTFGFVPHAGNTYYASRMPGDFGTFLILTGIPMTGKDAIKIGMADKLIEEPETYEEEVGDILQALDPATAPNSLLINGHLPLGIEHAKMNQVDQHHLEVERARNNQASNDVAELRTRLGMSQGEEFVDPRDRRADGVAQADIEYKNYLRAYNQARNPTGAGISYFSHDAPYFDQYSWYVDFLKLNVGHLYVGETRKSLLQHKEIIDRCFWHNSVEEIINSLGRETHPFAQEILEKMQKNSMLSMKLALKMLRKAKNMAYGETLKMEMNVALNKVGDADFQLGVKEVLMKPSKTSRLTGRPNPGFQSEVTEAEVESYFAQNKLSSQIDLDVVDNSLLPTRHFHEQYPDSIRVWINESSTPQEDVRNAVETEVKDLLRAEGIDMRDKTVTVPMAREYIGRKVRHQRLIDESLVRASQLMSDKKLRNWYHSRINDELQKVIGDRKAFYEIVNKNINKIFENAYLERLQTVQDKSREAQNLEKRRMFIRLKKFLIKSRILGHATIERDALQKQIEALPFKHLHMSEDWEKSHRDQMHPEIEQSVMWHISKVVGKASLAPPEMAKAYLTNPKAAKAQQVYVFDKQQLQKLQQDILENPEKYETMLQQESEDDGFLAGRDPGLWKQSFKDRMERSQYFHRIQNDGMLNSGNETLDNWPLRAEYWSYKHWVESIKSKAMDTLRYTVSRLLLDFENDEQVGNSVTNFKQGKSESNRAALERLLVTLNEKTGQNPGKVNQIITEKNRSISDNKRRAQQVKGDFMKVIDQDLHLQNLFGSHKQASSNQLIRDFREQMLNELLQLVEIVLVQKQTEAGVGQIDQEMLEKRLASVLSPKNTTSDKTSQLQIIDAYLSEKHGREVLAQAIDMIKPFFLSICQEKLDQETERVLDGFQKENTDDNAMEVYMLLKSNPKLAQNGSIQKLMNYHPLRENMESLEIAFPEESRLFTGRENLSSISDGLGSLVEQEKDFDQKTKALNQFTRESQQKFNDQSYLEKYADKAIQQDLQARRDRELRVPFEQEVYGEIDEFYAGGVLNQLDRDNLEIIERKQDELRDFIDRHKQELQSVVTNQDWLQIYSSCVNDHNVSIDHLIRNSTHHDQYIEMLEDGKLPLDVMREKFDSNSLTWQNLGEYARYLQGLNEATNEVWSGSNALEDREKMLDFMVSHDSRDSEKTSLSRESVFRAIADDRLSTRTAKTREDSYRDKLISMSQLHKRVTDYNNLNQQVLRLAKHAPKETREDIEAIIRSNSKYLDHIALLRHIQKRDWSQPISQKNFLNRNALLSDVQKGAVLQEFMGKYKNIKLDVVSIAEAKVVVNQAKNSNYDDQLISQITTVLDHVDDQMKYVSHDRRQQISLGEFMSRNHYLNANSYRHYSSELLKNQIENAMGRHESKSETQEAIDFEHGGVISRPSLSSQQVPSDQVQAKIVEAARRDEGSSEFPEAQIQDQSSGASIKMSQQEAISKTVYENAKKCTTISPQMVSIKNMYENKLLAEFTSPDYDVKKVEALIEEYTYARLKECQLNVDFASGIKSPNGHIYSKVLRERVMDELKMDEEASLDEFNWTTSREATEQLRQLYDPEAIYNLDHLNNEKAIGYNNLEARAEDLKNNTDLAHETVFDKMLAEFYLKNRGEYKQGNKLKADLENYFEEKLQDKNLKGNEAEEFGHPGTASGDPNSLGFHYLRQQVDKDDHLSMPASNFPALMELDVAVNRRLNNKKSGLSKQLSLLEEEDCIIPQYFEENDVRKPPHLYVQEKLLDIQCELFEARRSLEKNLGRQELIAYDQVMAKYLEYDVLSEKLKREIYKDFNELDQMNQLINHEKDNTRNQEKQLMKQRNKQQEFNKGIVNEDAFYKFFAYTGLLEKQRRDNHKETMNDPVLAAGYHSFEQFYQEELMQDAKRPAREIDHEALKPKKMKANSSGSDRKEHGFLDVRGRRDVWLDEHKAYKENKLEQQERIETFYVLEQFFESQAKSPASQENKDLYEAQEHIREYFSQPENTYFFDKNKLH